MTDYRRVIQLILEELARAGKGEVRPLPALAVEHELARLGGEDLPRVDRLVLFSPAIGVSLSSKRWPLNIATQLVGVIRPNGMYQLQWIQSPVATPSLTPAL